MESGTWGPRGGIVWRVSCKEICAFPTEERIKEIAVEHLGRTLSSRISRLLSIQEIGADFLLLEITRNPPDRNVKQFLQKLEEETFVF